MVRRQEVRAQGPALVPTLEGSRHGPPPVSAFAAAQEQQGGPGDEGGEGRVGGALAALAARVLEAACLLATDPVAGVAALGTALLRQIDVEVAVASLPGPRTPCEPFTPFPPPPAKLGTRPQVISFYYQLQPGKEPTLECGKGSLACICQP